MKKYVSVLSVIVFLPIAFIYYTYDPATKGISTFAFPKCPFYTVTHFYCPGCGSQRAVHQLLHGHIMQAADYNLLLVFSLPIVFYSAILFIQNTFSTKKRYFPLLYRPQTTWILLSVILLFWILRNIRAYPFYWLAP